MGCTAGAYSALLLCAQKPGYCKATLNQDIVTQVSLLTAVLQSQGKELSQVI